MWSNMSSAGDWSTARSVRSNAIGVDEIQYAKGHEYLTLVYQIDIGITRLRWVGRERTVKSFEGFFTTMGTEVISKIALLRHVGTLPEALLRRDNACFHRPRRLRLAFLLHTLFAHASPQCPRLGRKLSRLLYNPSLVSL